VVDVAADEETTLSVDFLVSVGVEAVPELVEVLGRWLETRLSVITEAVEVVLWVDWEVSVDAVSVLVWYVLKDVDGTEYVDWEELVPDEMEFWVEVDVVSVDVVDKVDEVKDTVEMQLVKTE
jgi:hypothetical protein